MICRDGWSVWGVLIAHVMTWSTMLLLPKWSSVPKSCCRNLYPSDPVCMGVCVWVGVWVGEWVLVSVIAEGM